MSEYRKYMTVIQIVWIIFIYMKVIQSNSKITQWQILDKHSIEKVPHSGLAITKAAQQARSINGKIVRGLAVWDLKAETVR